MVTQEGLSQCEVARRLGVAGTTVCGWVRQLAPHGRLTDQQMQTRLRELEQENRRLKMEREHGGRDYAAASVCPKRSGVNTFTQVLPSCLA